MALRISELADRSGFSPSTLRYYEAIGLLPSPDRTTAGYRVYDDTALERLAFIRRGKAIGLSLDEIAELVELWEDGPCAPVQQRLRDVVDGKLADARRQQGELQRFAAQLEHLSRSLADAEPADRCGPGCGCDAELASVAQPIACTLSAPQAADRSKAWADVVAQAVEQERVGDGLRLRLPATPAAVARAADLAVQEAECCAFFSFVITIDRQATWLNVTAPPEGNAVLEALFVRGATA